MAGGDRGVERWVDDLVIDAVDDPVQLAAKGPQQRVHLFAVFRREDLFRVAIADGVDDIREVEATTEQVDDVVEPGHAGLDQPPLFEIGQVEGAVAEDSLKSEVMDGEAGRDIDEKRVAGIEPR